ncbi:MAG TPA: hypothetical protein P5322_10775, partial [Spirochaetota bacterium]|nr:hypothetical protein [Spirochaetota bacterium]
IDEQIALVRNYIENRRYEHVIYTANKILLCKSRYSSQDVAIINHLIDAYYFMNDYQEQEHWLTIILTLTKSEYLAYYQEKLLMVYIMSGKMKTAAEYFNELVKNNQATQSFQEYLLIAQQNQNSKESSITAEDNTKRLLACLADIFKRFPN